MKFTEERAGLSSGGASMSEEQAGTVVERRGGWSSFRRLHSVALASAALAAVTYCILLTSYPPEPVPHPFAFDPLASWISTTTTHQATGCFRLDLLIPANVVNAWIVVAAHGGFEVLANGNSCARFFVMRPPRPFQNGLSEAGQRLTPSNAALSVRYPQYQWSDHDNAELPTWVDLTSALRLGRNALCVEVESSDTTPALIVSGEVLLKTGERIPIRSGAQWAAEPVPRTLPQDGWTDAQLFVSDWDHARVLPWKRRFWRLVPTGAYEEPFRGKRVRSVAANAVTWFQQDWDLSKKPVEAFLRVATDTPFQVWVNGRPVQPKTSSRSVLAGGPWFVRDTNSSTLNFALEALPERLNPDEVATLLPGQHDDNPTEDAAKPAGDPAPSSGNPGRYQSKMTEQNLSIQKAVRVVPPELTRDRRRMEFLAYSITPLLRAGTNTVRIGLYNDRPEAVGLSWKPVLAFDGGTRLADGGFSWFASGGETRCFSGTVEAGNSVDAGNSDFIPAAVDDSLEPKSLPTKKFFGHVYPDRPWLCFSLAFFCVSAGILFMGAARVPRLALLLEKGQVPFAVLAGWIGAGLLLRSAMLERSEALFWRFPAAALLLLAFGIIGAVLALVLPKARRPTTDLNAPEPRSDNRPSGRREWQWWLLAGLAILLCFAVRAWQIDTQPIDDDEYASVQASLAIAAKGVPEYQEGVWYTRSPLYHYLAGAVAAVSGGNLFSLRLLSVFTACATAMLLWKLCRQLTRNRFVAFSAVLLFALHPYLVFSGHVARFYQQQQFFHLLAVYFFLRGFVANSGMRDRYLTVLAFLAAALSQEISVLQLLPLAICCALFAQRRTWSDEIRLLVAAGCALALIALDVAFFQIRCLTALEGISPNVEATIGWRFDNATNFLAIFIGYSRLHLVLSVFLVAGFVITLWRRKKAWLCLYTYLFLSVVAANLLITLKSLRYEYALIPIWILLSAHGLAECAKLFVQAREHFPARAALAGGWLAVAVISWSPWRILPSYDQRIQGDSTGALRFVAENLRPGDRLAITEPHPHAALFETGQSDYAVSIPVLYDYVVRRRGTLVDRNGGAQVIGALGDLQQAFAQNERLWVVFNREQAGARGSEIPWQYPAARFQLYLRHNARLVFRSYLWSVYLWDRNAGHYSSFREKPGNWFE